MEDENKKMPKTVKVVPAKDGEATLMLTIAKEKKKPDLWESSGWQTRMMWLKNEVGHLSCEDKRLEERLNALIADYQDQEKWLVGVLKEIYSGLQGLLDGTRDPKRNEALEELSAQIQELTWRLEKIEKRIF